MKNLIPLLLAMGALLGLSLLLNWILFHHWGCGGTFIMNSYGDVCNKCGKYNKY